MWKASCAAVVTRKIAAVIAPATDKRCSRKEEPRKLGTSDENKTKKEKTATRGSGSHRKASGDYQAERGHGAAKRSVLGR